MLDFRRWQASLGVIVGFVGIEGLVGMVGTVGD